MGRKKLKFRRLMNSRTRFPELDLMRFLAACGVMLFHYTYLGPQNHIWSGSFPVLSQIFKYGYLGVNVFFILSGFVILLTAYDKDAVGFTVARMVRLYPAYWICVTLTALAIVLTGTNHNPITLRQYVANLTMVHGFAGIRDVSGVYWTLAVELQFYFLIFLVLLIGQIRRLGGLLGMWLFASIVLSIREPHGMAHFFLFPEWSSYFIAGAMLFLIHREGPSRYKLSVVGGCYILSTAYAIRLLPFGGDKLEAGFSAPIIASFLAVAYAAFIFIALRRRVGGGSNPFYILGLITYPLYLLHQDLGFILLRSGPSLNRVVLLCAVMVAMIVLAWVVHIGPEKWLASKLKSALSRPEKAAVSIHSLLVERLTGSNLRTAIPALVRATVSSGTASAQAVKSPAANSQVSKNSEAL
jgi:peptidoglycan/LPS O-acetylase OafA/YrhL